MEPIDVEISEEAIQEAKRKTKEVVKKEKAAKAVKKQEENSTDIAQEKIDKFNEHQREAFNAF